MLSAERLQDELSRTAKIFLDSGEAETLEAANEILGSYALSVRLGPDVANSPTLQAAVLTIINTARRCFLGGVTVVNCPEAKLLVRLSNCRSLKEAVISLEGSCTETTATSDPQIIVGNTSASTGCEFAVRATFNGWIGGVAPVDDETRLDESQEFAPSGVLAGALAVSEAFQFVRGKNPVAGKRSIGLSLWRPEPGEDWANTGYIGPTLEQLPSKLWLIGLGHLGQAFLWTLGMLPYANPEEVVLFLQDTDHLTLANDSTSPLTRREIVGQLKTRAMAEWCESRGFQTRIVERLFTDELRVVADEPVIALCGVDNAIARAALEEAKFLRVIEAGLGTGTEEYLAFQVHSFPGTKTAREIWQRHGAPVTSRPSTPAYKNLGDRGLDQCGLTMLANRSVGASFVGTVVSTLVIAEVLRILAGGKEYDAIDCTLRNIDFRELFPKTANQRPFNPGSTSANEFTP